MAGMRLVVRLFAGLRERAGSDSITLSEVPPGLDVADLKRLLEADHPELGSLGHVRGVIGTAWVPDSTPIQEGDEVSLLPPVSGGAAGSAPGDSSDYERGVFELVAEDLDPAAALARVADPSCGANVLFSGTTREQNRGKRVVELDYESFAVMAFQEMAAIFDAANQRFGPQRSTSESTKPAEDQGDQRSRRRLRMLVLHRSGVVGVGQPSVVVAVASPHRDPAFKAARFLIDELKARVPLWKREVYADGHHWIADRS